VPTRAEKIRADLLAASFQYIQGRRQFEGAITAARSIGWADEEIARVTGLSPAMVESVAPHADAGGAAEAGHVDRPPARRQP
jgi:hypothetical protein